MVKSQYVVIYTLNFMLKRVRLRYCHARDEGKMNFWTKEAREERGLSKTGASLLSAREPYYQSKMKHHIQGNKIKDKGLQLQVF